MKAFERCASLEPDHVDSLYEMACVYRVLHRFPDAVELFVRVLAKEAMHLAARYDLARTWYVVIRSTGETLPLCTWEYTRRSFG